MTDNSKYHFFKKLKNKYRLVVLNDGTFEERIVVKITPLLVLSFFLLVSCLLIFTTFLLFSYTPLKEYVPGKTTLETQKELISMSTKLDSLVIVVDSRDLYIDNLKKILSGEEINDLSHENKTKNLNKKLNLSVSIEDSLFRLKVEKKSSGDYIEKFNDQDIFFLPPVNGNFTQKYNKKKGHYGVDIVSKEGSVINAIYEGVVVSSDWTKESGFVIAIQHTEGFLSYYKHNSKLLKEVGDIVMKGDPIAIIGNSGELTSGPHLHFELWKNGESINPENYITF